MKSFTVIVYHSGSGKENLCTQFPPISATDFCMALAQGHKMALMSPQTGEITKIEVIQEK